MSGDGADQMRAFMDDSRRNDMADADDAGGRLDVGFSRMMSEAVRLRTARWGHWDNDQFRLTPTAARIPLK